MRKSACVAGSGGVGTSDVQHGVWVRVWWGLFLFFVQYKLRLLSPNGGLE